MKKIAVFCSLSALALVFSCGGNDGVIGDGTGSIGNGGKGDGTGSVGSGSTGSGSTGAGTGSTGSGSTGSGTGSTGNGFGGFPDDTFDYDPSKDADPTSCINKNVGTSLLPVDMFIMLDKSGSMTQPHGDNDPDGYCDVDETNWQDNGSRWCNSINALQDFFEASTSVGLGLSLAAFSGNEPTNNCVAADVMDVPFGVIGTGTILSETEAALNAWTPNGATPTEYAINTLIARTKAWRDDPSNTRDVPVVAILITDGVPNSNCQDGRTSLNTLMKNHFINEKIPFFVIGMDGVSASSLDQLAVNAGAKPHTNFCITGDASCSYYSVGAGNPATFTAALAEIQRAAMGCSFGIPSTDTGLVDVDTAVVNFTPATGAAVEALGAVADVGSCTTNKQYYVSGVDQDVIKLCPLTCDRVGDTSSVSINIKCAGN